MTIPNWRNPQYNAAGTIDCEIEHPALGWIPFTARPSDRSFFYIDGMIAEMIAADVIAPYVAPPDPTAAELRALMKPLTRRQVFIMLADQGLLTDQEAEDAAAGTAIPAAITATFDALETGGAWTAAEKRAARITFLSFTLAYRLDPMVPVLVSVAGSPPDDATLDTWWGTYALV